MNHATLTSLLLLSVLCLAASCGGGGSETAVEFRVPVRVSAVALGDVEDLIVGTGTLRPLEAVSLTVENSGTLTLGRRADGRRLAEGDRVERGQVIGTVTGEEVRLAARSAATAQRLLSATRDYNSKKALFEEGLIAEQELIQAEATLAEAQLEAERSRYTETRSELRSPIDGVLLRLARDERGRPLADGQRVVTGFVVAEVAPTGSLAAEVDLVGPDAARVQVAQGVRVRHHAWDARRFAGVVVRLAPSLDPVTRALRAEVEVDNGEGLLRPGMFIEATIVAERREQVPVVPRAALAERGGRTVVFVLKGQNVAERPVQTGLGDDDQVEIRNGVEEGERVVVRGLETLADDSPVRVTGS